MSQAPDGSPVEAYRLMRVGNEATVIHGATAPGGAILELGCGAGRVTHALLALGHPVTAVDQSIEMLESVRGAHIVHADIEDLDLGRRFAAVVLGSHLLNTDDDAQRHAFLLTCRRHVAADGVVLVEYLDQLWASSATEGAVGTDGVRVSIRRIRRHGGRLSAEAVYEVGGREWTQAWTARILDDEELATEFAAAGLTVHQRLTRSWISAVPS